ncbi:MAG TPA: hypothetical protein VF808_19760 [Ktedonobacterales bacterium]
MTLQMGAPGRALAATLIRALVVFDTLALFFTSIVHLLGARIPLGFAEFVEPAILPAGIVEGITALVFLAALYAMLTRRAWAWGITLAAHITGSADYIAGLIFTIRGTTPFNAADHRVMLALFAVGLLLLALPAGRVALAVRARPGSPPSM